MNFLRNVLSGLSYLLGMMKLGQTAEMATLVALFLAVPKSLLEFKKLRHEFTLKAMVTELRPQLVRNATGFTALPGEDQELINEATRVILQERYQNYGHGGRFARQT